MAELARAIADRYGIPVDDLTTRLSAGRFRVKGNVDRATADTYAQDLARLGALCTIVAAEAPAELVPAVSLPRVERAPAPAAPLPARATPSASWPPTDVEIPQELGALSGQFPLTLSTLDGATEDEARASRKVKLPASFAPPPDGGGDRSDDVPAAAPGGAVEMFDPFAPPEAQADAPELTLAVDRAPRRSAAPPPASSPPSAAVAPMSEPSTTLAAPAPPPMAAPAAAGAGLKGVLRDDARRLIAGAVLAVAIGAVPALLIGGARERATFAQLDGELEKRQSEILTREAWDGLDRVRAGYVERKRGERQSIAITSLMIWAALSGGFTWLWFRKLDWPRLLAD